MRGVALCTAGFAAAGKGRVKQMHEGVCPNLACPGCSRQQAVTGAKKVSGSRESRLTSNMTI